MRGWQKISDLTGYLHHASKIRRGKREEGRGKCVEHKPPPGRKRCPDVPLIFHACGHSIVASISSCFKVTTSSKGSPEREITAWGFLLHESTFYVFFCLHSQAYYKALNVSASTACLKFQRVNMLAQGSVICNKSPHGCTHPACSLAARQAKTRIHAKDGL
jgi:hypothetical protein